MRTYAICPISDKRINERVARINAIFTVLILVGFTLTANIFLVMFLILDFLLRSGNYSNYSLIGITSRNILRYLPVDEHFINAGPKIFAARIGLLFSTTILITMLTGVPLLAWGLTSILGLFSFLEAAFGLCVACEIYPFFYRMLYR